MEEYYKLKKNIEEIYTIKNRDLQRRQREYKKQLSRKLGSRKATILQSSLRKTSESLREEKDNLRAQIWVANGKTHVEHDEELLKDIECHIRCQQYLTDDMHKLKQHIVNMEWEISRVTKQVYELNCKTVPDSRHQQYVLGVRKKLHLLENQYEVGVRRECEFTASNSILREELFNLIHIRTDFNMHYTKMVARLNSDRKYITDLIEYVMETCDGCIAAYEKIDLITTKNKRFNERTKEDVNKLIRKCARDEEEHDFFENKTKRIELSDLQPKEYRRRELFRRNHNKKLNLYSKIIDKIMEYTDSKMVSEVISKYQQQESVYYSYFNFSNEMDYHMTLLNNSCSRLTEMIKSQMSMNAANLRNQIKHVQDMEDIAAEKKEQNDLLQKKVDASEERLKNLLHSMGQLIEMTGCEIGPLSRLLGDHTFVNAVNLREFLKILEKRIFDITAVVYLWEREDDRNKPAKGNYTVQYIERFCEPITILEDVVLTQMCPECAEGEAHNVDDEGAGNLVQTVQKAKEKLHEKVVAPEMQYRLHSISQCRLPRSRMLAAKRNA